MKASLGAVLVVACAATACSGRSGPPASAPFVDGASTAGASSAAASGGAAAAGSTRITFAAPEGGGAPAYQEQTFDVYEQPDDVYENPDLIVVSQGQTPPAGPGGNPPSPLAYAQIFYPDGSLQIAGADGSFTPADSTYGQNNAAELEADPSAGVEITIQDPSGVAQPLTTQVPAGTLDPPSSGGGRPIGVAQAKAVAGSAGAPASSSATADRVLSLSVVPQAIAARGGAVIPLSAIGLDADGHAASLSGTRVAWIQPAAGRIVPTGDGTTALYYAPANGTGVDRFGASLAPSGSNAEADVASGAVAYYGGASLARVSASLSGPAPAAGARLGFVQTGGLPSAIFPPALWFAEAKAGAFVARLPAGASVTPFVALAAPSPGLFSALGPGGASYTVPATGSAAFGLASPAQTFALPQGPAIPPVATAIRDAFFVSALLRGPNPFEAGSGLQPLLARPFAPASGTVPAGTFAGWRFAWTTVGGAPQLTLVEAAGGAAGTDSITISPAGDGATFTFARYHASTPLSLAAPLTAAQPGALLAASGAWSQSSNAAGVFGASLRIGWYDAHRQSIGSPLYTEIGTYAARNGGAASYSGMALYDGSGTKLWAYDGTRAAAGAAGFAASLTRFSPNVSGAPLQTAYRLSGHATGSGAAAVTLSAVDGSVTVGFDLAETGSATGGSVAGRAGPVATFGIGSDGFVSAVVGADPATGYPGAALDFAL